MARRGATDLPAASVLVGATDSASRRSSRYTNPWRDNGIKLFGPDGTKLDDAFEAEVERVARSEHVGGEGLQVGRVRTLENALDDCARAAVRVPARPDRPAHRLDCANGATYRAAPAIFERLGATVEALSIEPDGRNINEGCGSTHPEALAERVRDSDAEIGFALDGDGDRLIAVDAAGTARNGDDKPSTLLA